MTYKLSEYIEQKMGENHPERVNELHLRIFIPIQQEETKTKLFNILNCDTDRKNVAFNNLSPNEHKVLSDFSFQISEDERIDERTTWTINQRIEPETEIYGMGDKAVVPNLRGRKCIIWGTDTYAFEYGAEPLYKNIPFYIRNDRNGVLGVFINNTHRIEFDFGYSDERIHISGSGGHIDMYLIFGESPLEVVTNYTKLTGTPHMPPLWALGFHQSKWSYVPEQALMDVAAKFRELNIPCDSIYLDIDYMRGYRVFTWDKRRFPDPKAMLKKLRHQGFQIVAILDPGIKIDKRYAIYKEAISEDFFIKNPDASITSGPVWPGYCHFPDFTSRKVRRWWADHVAELVRVGLAGIWNDMNEPALFNKADMIQTQRTLNEDARMNFEGESGDFAEGHNLYGMLMSEATMEGFRQAGDRRPFVLTRSTYAGGQKFAAVWTGDNVATWEHLRIANYQCQNLALSGFSFAGSDIGGFVGNPDGELFCRWLQLALFHPFFRNHSSKDFAEQEPWSFGEKWTDCARQIIHWRYRLLGYIYTVFRRYVHEGIPMIKPVNFVHAKEKRPPCFDQFYLGDALLAIPVMEPGQSGVRISLPEGYYYDVNSARQFIGNNDYFIRVKMDAAPALLKGGHILPIWPAMQYVNEKPLEEMEIWCGFSDAEKVISRMYLDEFDGHSYLEGNYQETVFEYNNCQTYVLININQSGYYQAAIRKYTFKFPGFKNKIKSIESDGNKLEISKDDPIIVLEKMPEKIRIDLKS